MSSVNWKKGTITAVNGKKGHYKRGERTIKDAQHNQRCVWTTKRTKQSEKPCVTDITFFLVKKAGRHFSFFK